MGAAPLAAGCVRLMRRDTTRHSPPSQSVDIQHTTDNSVQGNVQVAARARSRCSAGAISALVRVQAAAAVSGPRQPRVTVRVGSLHREHVPPCPGYNGRNSELKFNHWCWSKLVSDLLIVFPNPIL